MRKRKSIKGSQRPSGFTLVELLVVITIIGILIGMLLPAVNAGRESGRRIQCEGNLKQIAMACLAHEEAQGFFPTGGWGHVWMGDPNRGFSNKQPGGWCFNILPNLDQDPLWRLCAIVPQTPGVYGSSTQVAQANQLWSTPVPVFKCPTRGRPSIGPNPGANSFLPFNTPANLPLFREDYAANMGGWGDDGGYQSTNYPSTYAASDAMSEALWDSTYNDTYFDGIVYKHSQVRMASITDGPSCTYLVCEKYLDPDHYADGVSQGDDQGAWCGFDRDTSRQADPADPPVRDVSGLDNTTCFGSAHVTGFNASFCDGSVHFISYSIDINTHQNLGSRNDGNAIDMTKVGG